MNLLVPAFVDLILKSTAILAIAAAFVFALRRASAPARHFVWTVALFALLVLPVLPVILPVGIAVPIPFAGVGPVVWGRGQAERWDWRWRRGRLRSA